MKNVLKDPGGALNKFVDDARREFDKNGVTKLITKLAIIYGTKKLAQKVKISYKNRIKFGKNCKNHLMNPERFGKTGVSGGHNQKNFHKYLKDLGIDPDEIIIKRTKHSTIKGITEYEYSVPKKGHAPTYEKPYSYRTKPQRKTVYDPNVISNDQMYKWGK